MSATPLAFDALVGELFGRAAARRGWVTWGWVLALASHAAAALLVAQPGAPRATERTRPPVEVEFVNPPEVPASPPREPAAQPAKAVQPVVKSAAPPAAARAGALHLAHAEATPAQQEEAVDFTTDPRGAEYGGGVVAVAGTAAFGAAGARVSPVAGQTASAPAAARPVSDGLTPASDLSRKPRLPGSDPCRGFFPSAAQDDLGDTAVLVTIDKSGHVTRTQLVSEAPAGQGFGAAARACLASQHFEPALDRAGNSAATAIRVNIRFSR